MTCARRRTWTLRLALVALSFAIVGGPALATQESPRGGVVRIAVEVELDCPSCAAGLERRLSRLDGVGTVDVRPAQGQVVVTPGPEGEVSPADVREVIRNAGFIPTDVVVTAVGVVDDVDGHPVLELREGVVMRLTFDDAGPGPVGRAGQRVTVRGHALGATAGAGEHLRVVAIESSAP